MASTRKHARADLLEWVRRVLRPRILSGARFCVGLSGGLDSVVLLHLLARLRQEAEFPLAAVHVHHGLSPQADTWLAFCADLCNRLGVPLTLERVTVRPAELGVEAAAREARYQVYARQAADCIVLAHQQDDQAETLLLNLLRGAGVAGLAGMSEARLLSPDAMWLLRPLLDIPRSEILAYARAEGLCWVEDESNLDTGYARNYLRQAVLPVLEARFPAYRTTLGRAARHLAECEALLEDLARIDARDAIAEEGLAQQALMRLSRPRAKNLLRSYLASLGLTAWSEPRLEALLDQALRAGSGSALRFPAEGLSLRFWRGWLRPVADRPQTGVDELPWHGEAALDFAGGRLDFAPAVGQGLNRAMLEKAPACLRLRKGGERLRPDCRRPRRDLKKLFQERAIPPWERDGLPMLYVGDALAWVAGLGADCLYQAAPGEPGMVISWRPAGR